MDWELRLDELKKQSNEVLRRTKGLKQWKIEGFCWIERLNMKTVFDNYIRSQEVKDYSIHHQTIASLKLIPRQIDTMTNQTYKHSNGQTVYLVFETTKNLFRIEGSNSAKQSSNLQTTHNTSRNARAYKAELLSDLFHWFKRSSRQSLEFQKTLCRKRPPKSKFIIESKLCYSFGKCKMYLQLAMFYWPIATKVRLTCSYQGYNWSTATKVRLTCSYQG